MSSCPSGTEPATGVERRLPPCDKCGHITNAEPDAASGIIICVGCKEGKPPVVDQARAERIARECVYIADRFSAQATVARAYLALREESQKLHAIIDATDAARRFVAGNPANLQPLLNFLRGLP